MINIRKSHSQLQQCTLQFVCEDRVLFVRVDLHVSLCGQQEPKCKRAICLVYPHFFYKLRFSSNPTNKNLMELCLEIQTALSGQIFRIRNLFILSFFLMMANTLTSQNTYPSSVIALDFPKYFYCKASVSEKVHNTRVIQF